MIAHKLMDDGVYALGIRTLWRLLIAHDRIGEDEPCCAFTVLQSHRHSSAFRSQAAPTNESPGAGRGRGGGERYHPQPRHYHKIPIMKDGWSDPWRRVVRCKVWMKVSVERVERGWDKAKSASVRSSNQGPFCANEHFRSIAQRIGLTSALV
jgi:hypothetical protein